MAKRRAWTCRGTFVTYPDTFGSYRPPERGSIAQPKLNQPRIVQIPWLKNKATNGSSFSFVFICSEPSPNDYINYNQKCDLRNKGTIDRLPAGNCDDHYGAWPRPELFSRWFLFLQSHRPDAHNASSICYAVDHTSLRTNLHISRRYCGVFCSTTQVWKICHLLSFDARPLADCSATNRCTVCLEFRHRLSL